MLCILIPIEKQLQAKLLKLSEGDLINNNVYKNKETREIKICKIYIKIENKIKEQIIISYI